MDHERYLSRIGIDPEESREPTLSTLEQLQQAHVRRVPFETLSITGDPFGTGGSGDDTDNGERKMTEPDGEGISLAITDLYEKIVGRRRGGFCYELNGLFGWLLTELGFDVDRLAARIDAGGELGPPADHLTLLVSLDRQYIVDVGLGLPKLRRPLHLTEDREHTDAAGIGWRLTESDRPDADYEIEYTRQNHTEWERRCILRTVPREMSYFEATCEYFQLAPESHFRGDPTVIRATEQGHAKLSPDSLTRSNGGELRERSISAEEWYELLEGEFGVRYRTE